MTTFVEGTSLSFAEVETAMIAAACGYRDRERYLESHEPTWEQMVSDGVIMMFRMEALRKHLTGESLINPHLAMRELGKLRGEFKAILDRVEADDKVDQFFQDMTTKKI